MKVIGLTGGIGSGKSAVTDYLLKRAYAVTDADLLAREVVAAGTEGLAAVVARFGEDVLCPDGNLNRKALAARVFSDEEARAALNALLHGRIARAVKQDLARHRAADRAVVFLSVPLLLETGMQSETDAVWLVEAAEDLRVRRIKARDGLSEEDARRRLAAQLPSSEKRRYAAEIIDNSGTLCALYRAIDALLEKYGF
jgi:dephospho-CoA kinase